MNGRLLAAFSSAAVVGLALVGCSSGSAGSATSSGASGGSVSYMTWEANDTNAALDATFKKFSSQSGITVSRQEAPNTDYAQKLASQLMAKNAPDFFWCSTSQEQNLAAEGLLFDWTSYLKDKSKGLDEAQFAPGAVDLFTARDGKVYGIPTLANTYGVFYNASVFKAAGVPIPTNDWTFDDMLADAKALTGAKGTSGAGLVTQWPLLESPLGVSAAAVANGGQPLLDKNLGATKATASPELKDVAAKYREAISAGYMTGPDFDSTNSMAVFSNGGTAMMFGGQWLAQFIKPTGAGFDWGFAPWPKGTATDLQPIEANGVCSPASLKNADATYKAIAYMEQTGFNDVMRAVPVAPIAYTPGSTGYFENLSKQGGGLASIGATAKFELAAKDKFVTQLLDPWATKANDVVTASWNPAIGGKAPLDAGIAATVSGIQQLIDSQH